ncbi:MAG TPA: RnfABCDGE type electron transport complex subunit D, partial [Patescibacteria group bacterium]|nr:RnfABCDGE type electron transport complex subunit D [Patescibacteria group bacterium]
VILSFFGILSFSPLALIFSIFIINLLSWITNEISAWWFGVPANVESVYITAFILILIITPVTGFDLKYFAFLLSVTIIAQASKYIIAAHRKHIFNPAAIAVAITAFTITQSASWWIGTTWMMPFVLIGGLLVARKLRRFNLVLTFFAIAIVTVLAFGLANGTSVVLSLRTIIFSSPLLFFGFIMLTEPLTTPPTKRLQIIYGALVGFLFAPQINFLGIYSTPELALLVGNVFSYIVSPKKKLMLTLKEKLEVGENTYNFIFSSNDKMKFNPGQYMEWTVGHKNPDNRGNRRYFTIASSPTEDEIIMGVKFYEPSSSYKKALTNMQLGSQLLAGQLAGDFTLPPNPQEKSVFIAGGIGVTPFRSMIKYLIDAKQRRDIVLFYSNNTEQEIVYKDVFDIAEKNIGLKTVYTLSDKTKVSANWKGGVGFIDAKMIAKQVPDYKDRLFYISGPHGMVTAFEKTLSEMGVPNSKIKVDFFPGYV